MSTSVAVVERLRGRFDIEIPPEVVRSSARGITLRTRGRRHGPITRLVSPSDIGELIKPFVFLDQAEVAPRQGPLFGIHPHSGIATLTVVLRGGMAYEDTTGKAGSVRTGGLEWMKAGNGVWHVSHSPPHIVPILGTISLILPDYAGIVAPIVSPTSTHSFPRS